MRAATIFLCAAVASVALAGDPLYPLKVGPTKRYLLDRNNHPVLIHGDTAWSLITALTKAEAEQYLENRRQKGFNAIMVNLIEHKFNGPATREGEQPFGTPGDFSTPNEKYFAHADWVIRKAAEKAIAVFLFPLYLGYEGTDEGWWEETLANGPLACGDYGRFVGRRYKDFDNIVWVMGGDRNPGRAWEHTDAVAGGIKEENPRHLFTAHAAPERSAADEYARGGWLDLNTTYTYQIVHRRLRRDFSRQPVMPFVLMESTYEGEHNASAVQIRRQAYWALLCGASGQFFGNRPIWLFDPGWQAATDAEGSRDMVHLRALFLSRPWHELVPDDKHQVVISGLGEFNGLDYLTAARTRDGGTLIAYMPSSRQATVDMTQISGERAVAWWYSPRTGEATPAGEFPTRGRQTFLPPGSADWVLVVDDASRNLPAPGSPATANTKQ